MLREGMRMRDATASPGCGMPSRVGLALGLSGTPVGVGPAVPGDPSPLVRAGLWRGVGAALPIGNVSSGSPSASPGAGVCQSPKADGAYERTPAVSKVTLVA